MSARPAAASVPTVATGRAQFIAVRDELRARHADDDLCQVWDEMNQTERALVLRAALIPTDRAIDGIERFTKGERASLREAIERMSRFANGLKGRCQSDAARHPERELADVALQALNSGDSAAARHFLTLIRATP